MLEDSTELVRDRHGHPRQELVGEWFAFMRTWNYGMAFGRGQNMPWILVGGRVLVAIFLTLLITRAPRRQPVYLGSLVLILAGALGNLYDNLLKPLVPEEGRPFGPVRDFIDVYFGIWDWHFPTFNVADSYISVGAVLLLASGLFTREAVTSGDVEPAETDAETSPGAEPLSGPAPPAGPS